MSWGMGPPGAGGTVPSCPKVWRGARSPSHAPCASRLRHLSTGEAAKRLAVMSSSVPCRCRMKVLSTPGAGGEDVMLDRGCVFPPSRIWGVQSGGRGAGRSGESNALLQALR